MNEREVRIKFYDAARSMYPNAADPGVVWVVTQVLGWSWEDVTCTAVDGLSRSGYRRFVVGVDGKKVLKDNDEPLVVTRKWTTREKSLLKDWWWLINL